MWKKNLFEINWDTSDMLKYIPDLKINKKTIKEIIRGFSNDNSCSTLLNRLKQSRLQLGLDVQTQIL